MTREEPPAAIGPLPGEGDLPNSPQRLALAMFWQVAFIGAFFPLLPAYLIGHGVSASAIALLFAVYALTAMAIGQAVGYLADTAMTRTRLISYMALGSAAVASVVPLAPHTLPWLCAAMVLLSLFNSQVMNLFSALTLASRRGEELFGPIRMLGSVGFVVVTLVVGGLANLPAFTPAVMWPVMVFIQLMVAASLLPIADRDPRQRLGDRSGRIGFFRAQRLLLGNRLLRRFLLFTFLTQMINVPGHTNQFTFLPKLGSTPLFVTVAVTVAAVSEMAVFWWGARLLRGVRLPTLFALVPLAMAVRFGSVFLVPTPMMILLSNTLHVITFGMAYLSGVVFVNREAPPELRSSAQAVFGIVFANLSTLGGNVATAGILEFLTKRAGVSDTEALGAWYGIAALCCVIAVASLVPLVREYDRRHGQA